MVSWWVTINSCGGFNGNTMTTSDYSRHTNSTNGEKFLNVHSSTAVGGRFSRRHKTRPFFVQTRIDDY